MKLSLILIYLLLVALGAFLFVRFWQTGGEGVALIWGGACLLLGYINARVLMRERRNG